MPPIFYMFTLVSDIAAKPTSGKRIPACYSCASLLGVSSKCSHLQPHPSPCTAVTFDSEGSSEKSHRSSDHPTEINIMGVLSWITQTLLH